MSKIAISAAEHSGDLLAGELIKILKNYDNKLEFFGLAGDKMVKAGCEQIWDTQQVSVMGFTEVIKKLPQLIKLRQQMIAGIIAKKPALFIGVDAPDFNLKIEYLLKQQQIKTVHFISPSVWAWRAYRVKKIKKSTDLVLCIFPFEVEFYQKHQVNAVFIGHPLTKLIQPRNNYIATNNILLMPGSRSSEIKIILPIMLAAAALMTKQNRALKFSLALLDNKLLPIINQQINNTGIKITIVWQKSHEQLQKSDLVISASGTATLEALIIGVPMVVVHKLSTISYLLAKSLIRIPFISLPNIISNKKLVPELVQKQAKPDNIAKCANELLNKDNTKLLTQFRDIYQQLNQDSTNLITTAITKLL